LLELNLEDRAAEVTSSLHNKKKPPPRRPGDNSSATQTVMFNDD
jgi:hypothetical protein